MENVRKLGEINNEGSEFFVGVGRAGRGVVGGVHHGVHYQNQRDDQGVVAEICPRNYERCL